MSNSRRVWEQFSQRRLVFIYEAFVIFLVLSYSILLLQSTFDGIPDMLSKQEMLWLDYGLICLFVVEYLVRLWKAPEKWKFVKKNWFDVIAMLPLDSYFRFFRILRLVRLVRMSKILSAFFQRKEIKYSLIVVWFVVLWGAAGVYLIEGKVNENIETYPDAIWWAIVTTTTVGYGDISPVTLGGRLIAVVLMFTGIGMIGSVTASVATHFIEYLRIPKQIAGDNRIRHDMIKLIKAKVNDLEKLSEEEYQYMLSLMETIRKKDQL